MAAEQQGHGFFGSLLRIQPNQHLTDQSNQHLKRKPIWIVRKLEIQGMAFFLNGHLAN
ncbi:hypothetical protein PGT21_019385 [Puccinia graminis f. sp. tritici]|uniref:Uncharacterized protein n=1 Tax=Puccinia graminis f. sp. tritici TaxID=56615 RepID=A0A5B0PP77_PUCGR|nr:hypothetical protein PGT21_019385 [Puccinia graminis f. sp. tritici]